MEELYQAHFGLTQPPFKVTPDPDFLYLGTSHREALAQLSYGIKARKGFVVLTGEVGTGKTTMIHSLLNELPAGTHTALVFSTVVGPVDLLRYVCEEFNLIELKHPRAELHDYLVLLNEFLLAKYRSGDNCVLIIDEAQNLSAEVLEGVRVLSNFETSTDKLLQIVLVGQPELSARLNTAELRQLKQRVTLRHHLRALTLEECRDYIGNRLRKAGGNPAIFTSQATEAIYRYSGGVPRLVNILCDNALLTAYAVAARTVEASIIREVADDLNLIPTVGAIAARTPVYASNGTAANGKGREAVEPPAALLVAKPAAPKESKPAAPVGDFVSPRTLQTIAEALTEAMGPMARIVVRDQIRSINGGHEGFPREKVWKLIDAVSQEICDELMRKEFRRKMTAEIPVAGRTS